MKVLGRVEESVHTVHATVYHVTGSVCGWMVVGFHKFGGSITQLENCLETSAFFNVFRRPTFQIIDSVHESCLIKGMIGVPDPCTDFGEVFLHPLATASDFDKTVQETHNDSDCRK